MTARAKSVAFGYAPFVCDPEAYLCVRRSDLRRNRNCRPERPRCLDTRLLSLLIDGPNEH